MQFTKREWKIAAQAQRLALVLGFGAIMGLAGPFGTYPALARPVRYAFWIGLVLAGYIFALGAARLTDLFPSLARAGRWALNGLIALASGVPMTFVVAWTLSLVQPGRVVPPTQLPILFVCVAAVQIVIVVALIRPVVGPVQSDQSLPPIGDAPAAGGLDAGGSAQTANPNQPARPEISASVAPAESPADDRKIQTPSDAAPPFPAALLARVPRELGPDIVALEAEDHYVRIHTPKGSTLALMRLSDAEELLEEALGMRVHRSWWVASRAIESLERDGQRVMLRLTTGAQVPVGRMYAAGVRRALRES